MNKLKKIFAVALSLVMACIFATTAFAATPDEIKAELKAQGLSDTEIDALAGLYTVADYEAGLAKWNSGDEATIKQAVAEAEAALKNAGVNISDVTVTVADGKATVTAKLDGKAVSAAAPITNASEHPEIAEAIANGTWGVDESTGSTTNVLVSSSSSVIKATGDNSAVVLVAAVLAVAGVLGLAVRKNNSVA